MQQLIQSIYAGENLSTIQAQQLFTEMLSGEMQPIQIAGILIALKMKRRNHK